MLRVGRPSNEQWIWKMLVERSLKPSLAQGSAQSLLFQSKLRPQEGLNCHPILFHFDLRAERWSTQRKERVRRYVVESKVQSNLLDDLCISDAVFWRIHRTNTLSAKF